MDTNQALIRDEYRCAVTKKYDYLSVKLNRELKGRVMSDPDNARAEHTQCAHILSESTNSGIASGSEKVYPPFNFFSFCLINNNYLCIAGLFCHDVGGHGALWV
jgi:hypothetical protein